MFSDEDVKFASRGIFWSSSERGRAGEAESNFVLCFDIPDICVKGSVQRFSVLFIKYVEDAPLLRDTVLKTFLFVFC